MVKNIDVINEFTDFGTDESIKTDNVFFEQDVLYSYGYHFPLLVRFKDFWIINKSKYSSTTSKHQNYCRRCISGNIKEMNTSEIKELLLQNLNDKGLRFVTFEELNKLRVLKQLENEN